MKYKDIILDSIKNNLKQQRFMNIPFSIDKNKLLKQFY